MKLDSFLADSGKTLDDLQNVLKAEGLPPLPAAGSPQDQLRDLCLTDASWPEVHAYMARYALDINGYDSQGQTLLSVMATAGNLRRVKDLLELGKADPNVNDAFGEYGPQGPLHAACMAGFAEIVKLLLECGSSISLSIIPAFNDLHWFMTDVIERKHWEVAKLLILALPSGAPATVFDEIVVWAVDGGSLELVELLLSRGANPDDFAEAFLETALDRAIATRNVDMVRLLLHHGATASGSFRGHPPIIDALMLDPVIGSIVRLLIDHGAPLTSDTFKVVDERRQIYGQ